MWNEYAHAERYCLFLVYLSGAYEWHYDGQPVRSTCTRQAAVYRATGYKLFAFFIVTMCKGCQGRRLWTLEIQKLGDILRY